MCVCECVLGGVWSTGLAIRIDHYLETVVHRRKPFIRSPRSINAREVQCITAKPIVCVCVCVRVCIRATAYASPRCIVRITVCELELSPASLPTGAGTGVRFRSCICPLPVGLEMGMGLNHSTYKTD